MNTEPGIVPWSCSSCSRTSRNVASPSRGSASSGCDLADPRTSPGRAARGSSPSPKAYLRGRVFPRLGRSDPRPRSRAGPSPSWLGHAPRPRGVERRRLARSGSRARAPCAQRGLGQRRRPGRRRARCPAARNTSAPAAARWARSRSSGTRFSPNEIVADFSIPPHSRHGGSSSPARTRSRVSSIGPRQPHAEALDRVHGAVDLDDALGRRARGLVQPVDVLGDERVQRGAPLELGERAVAGVGLAAEQLALGAVAPHLPAVLGVGHVVLDRRRLLGRGSLVHMPFGPRKSGMPDSVEMPAPVSTTIWPASRNQRRRSARPRARPPCATLRSTRRSGACPGT